MGKALKKTSDGVHIYIGPKEISLDVQHMGMDTTFGDARAAVESLARHIRGQLEEFLCAASGPNTIDQWIVRIPLSPPADETQTLRFVELASAAVDAAMESYEKEKAARDKLRDTARRDQAEAVVRAALGPLEGKRLESGHIASLIDTLGASPTIKAAVNRER